LKNEEMAPDGHSDSQYMNHILVQTQVKLRFQLKYKITGRRFIEHLQIRTLLGSGLERGYRQVVNWCSSYNCL